MDNFQKYLKQQPEGTQNALMELRKIIMDAAPGCIETMNYHIPAFALIEGGKREQQIMIDGYKKHVGLYPHPTTMGEFSEDREPESP